MTINSASETPDYPRDDAHLSRDDEADDDQADYWERQSEEYRDALADRYYDEDR